VFSNPNYFIQYPSVFNTQMHYYNSNVLVCATLLIYWLNYIILDLILYHNNFLLELVDIILDYMPGCWYPIYMYRHWNIFKVVVVHS